MKMNKKVSDYKWVFYGVSILCYILMSPRWSVSFSAWVAPLAMLLYLRLERPKKGLLITALGLFISSLIGAQYHTPLPFLGLLIVVLIQTPIKLIPFLIDRLTYHKYQNIITTLIFPIAYVSLEYLLSLTISGVAGSIANTQYGNLYLLQLLSVTGIWGISFLIYWFASVGSYFVINYTIKKTRYFILCYGGVFLLTVIFGAIRLGNAHKLENKHVKISGVTIEPYRFYEAIYQDHFGKKVEFNNMKLSVKSILASEAREAVSAYFQDPKSEKFKRTEKAIIQLENKLFEYSQKEAESGSKIIVWSETNAVALQNEKLRFLERAKQFCIKNKVYLVPSIAIIDLDKITSGDTKFMEVKAYMIDPNGKILSDYDKAKPVPFMDAAAPGDGIVPVANTPFGNISQVICYDADFPNLISQAGRKGTDILLIPSHDWVQISPFHSDIATYRAIENGFSVFRQVSAGKSIACDQYGRVLSTLDISNEEERILVAYVPTKKISTIYLLIGDLLAYMCLVGTLLVIIFAIFKKEEKLKAEEPKKSDVNELVN